LYFVLLDVSAKLRQDVCVESEMRLSSLLFLYRSTSNIAVYQLCIVVDIHALVIQRRRAGETTDDANEARCRWMEKSMRWYLDR
jgi:hypothetical protein